MSINTGFIVHPENQEINKQVVKFNQLEWMLPDQWV